MYPLLKVAFLTLMWSFILPSPHFLVKNIRTISKICSKVTAKIQQRRQWRVLLSLCWFWVDFTRCCGFSIVCFEQVIAFWITRRSSTKLIWFFCQILKSHQCLGIYVTIGALTKWYGSHKRPGLLLPSSCVLRSSVLSLLLASSKPVK